MHKFLICFYLLLLGTGVVAQPNSSTKFQADSLQRIINPAPTPAGVKDPAPSDGTGRYLLTTKETVLSFSILISLFVILIIEVWLVNRLKISDDNAIKLILITLILMGTLFIVMAGYDERVLAPVFGLFGTIVGYLFGKSSSKTENS